MTSGTDSEVKHTGSHVLIDKIELKELKKLQKLVKDELRGWEVEWKDFKPECGTAALDQHGANMVMAVLKSLLEGSKK